MSEAVLRAISLPELEALLDRHEIVTKASEGDAMTCLSFNAGPFRALIIPYGEGPTYNSLQFHTSFSDHPTLEQVNKWNREVRYAHAFLDDEGDVSVNYDLDLQGGLTEDALFLAVSLFIALVDHFVAAMQPVA